MTSDRCREPNRSSSAAAIRWHELGKVTSTEVVDDVDRQRRRHLAHGDRRQPLAREKVTPEVALVLDEAVAQVPAQRAERLPGLDARLLEGGDRWWADIGPGTRVAGRTEAQ